MASHQSLARRAIEPDSAQITLEEAVHTAEQQLGAPRDATPATLNYVLTEDGSLKLTHSFQVRKDEDHKWMHVSVGAYSGTLN
jgi:hypothetical protein